MASRKRMIERSRVDIDYDRLHADRREQDVSEKQMEGCKVITGLPVGGSAGFKWRNVPISATTHRDARLLLWIVSASFLTLMALLVVYLFYFY